MTTKHFQEIFGFTRGSRQFVVDSDQEKRQIERPSPD